MIDRSVFSKSVAVGTIIALQLLLFPASGEGAPRDSVIRGKVFESDRKTPIAGVAAKAIHLETEEIFESRPSESNGRYRIIGLPQGHFDLVFESTEGIFLSNRVIVVPPSGKVTASFALTIKPRKREWWEPEPRRVIPGTDQKPDGVARIRERNRTKSFWKSRKGIAVLVGSGTLVAILVFDTGDGRETASPSSP